MKKFILITSVLLLTACNPAKPQVENQPQANKEAVEEMSNLAQDIQEGKSVQCVFTNKETNQTMTSLMKANKIKITNFINPDQQDPQDSYGMMIFDGQYTYTWNDQTKQGLKMEIPQDQSQPNDQADQVPDLTQEDIQRQYEDLGYTMKCNPQDISENEFTPPQDVQFTDMSQMVKDLPAQMSEEQLEQMQQNLEQFNQQ